jgi:hypothetical protein
MFWIGFIDKPLVKLEAREEGKTGLLVLGNHKEELPVHFGTWSESQYVSHWRSALFRALDGRRSALVTDMRLPSQSSHLVWWPMWRVGSSLVFHNQLLFFEQYGIHGTHLDVENLYEFTGVRLSNNKEGTPLSEWFVPVSAVEEFLMRFKVIEGRVAILITLNEVLQSPSALGR